MMRICLNSRLKCLATLLFICIGAKLGGSQTLYAPQNESGPVYKLFLLGYYDRFLVAADHLLQKYPGDYGLKIKKIQALTVTEDYKSLSDYLKLQMPYDPLDGFSELWIIRGLVSANKLDAGMAEAELVRHVREEFREGRNKDLILQEMFEDEKLKVSSKLFFQYAAYRTGTVGFEGKVALAWIKRDFPNDPLANELFAMNAKTRRPTDLKDEQMFLRKAIKGSDGDRRKRLAKWLEEVTGLLKEQLPEGSSDAH